jgi:hypothetical protein
MYFKAGNTVFQLSGPLVGILKLNQSFKKEEL